MLVVSDTSPISGLLILEKLELLKELYGIIHIPFAVKTELERVSERKNEIIHFINSDWVKIHKISNLALYEKFISELDEGESQAITLALELKADLLLIDETLGRNLAMNSGLNVIGLLGVLLDAKNKGFILEIKPLLDKLIQSNFWIKPSLYNKVLQVAKEII